MAKQIARLLKTDVMADIDIPAIAQFLQSQGRRGDTILAHINAKEAEMLKQMGGAEERNPVTGLPEYFTIADDYAYGADPYKDTPNVSNTNYDLGQYDLPALDTGYPGDYSPGQMFAGGEVPYNVEIDSMGRNLPISTETGPTGYAGQFQMKRPNREELLDRFSVPGLRMEGGREGFDIGGRALNPDLTVPEGLNIYSSRSASDAREMANRDLASGRRDPGVMDRASAATGLSKEALARLGLAGIGTIQGIMASREASEQGRQARRETEALARPYQQRGEALIQQAQAGELTAAGQQQLQALRARLAQGAEARGGVGAAQAAAQVEAFRQNLLQNQFDYGQKVSNIGDQLMLGAIRTGLEADRYAAGLSNTYFTNMASIAAGMPVQQRGEQ
jgi:hypothetical protein